MQVRPGYSSPHSVVLNGFLGFAFLCCCREAGPWAQGPHISLRDTEFLPAATVQILTLSLTSRLPLL
jgi:hypothetical protein